MKFLAIVAVLLSSSGLVSAAGGTPTSLQATDVCVGSRHCVGHGLSLARAEKFFGLKGQRFVKVDDFLTYSCFKVGKYFVLALYSSQGLDSVQPEELDVAPFQQANCVRPREATRKTDATLLPIGIGESEQNVIAKFGSPSVTWKGPSSAHDIPAGGHALVYRSPDMEQTAIVFIAGGYVTRVIGSIAP